MKKIIYSMIFLCSLLVGCQENEMNTFDNEGAVYFQLSSDWNDMVDSVVYSFAGKIIEEDTLWLQVDLMGEAVNRDRALKLSVDAEHTDAIDGTHYAPLLPEYILPSGAYQMQVPIILYNKDPQLDNATFQLVLQLEPTKDLQLGLTERTKVRILLTAMLMKPSYYEDGLSYYFGAYSKRKHEICIQVLGMDFPATYEEFSNNWDFWVAAGSYMDNYFYENYPIIDPETNMPIEPWL